MLLEFQNSIIQGDCRKVLSELPTNFIQLTITSPPYRNAIDYEAHIEKNGYYRGKPRKETAEYLDEMVQIFNSQLYRVTKDGGYCCLVIGNEVVNGTIIPPDHL
ncbi:MAG: site-specific DNA-methyltransferase [Thaumarchaeota archaeon]|nr:MAG: site-specific DNA-methyltransferase [Nitrososphaerota archaeon]